MHHVALFPALAAVARAVVYTCSAFWLFGFAETQQVIGFRLIPFLIVEFLCWLLLHLFLRRPRPLPAVVGAGAFLAAGSGFVMLRWFFVSGSPLSLALGVLFIVLVTGRAVQVCSAPITAAQSISALERCTGFLIVFLWFQGASGIPAVYAVPLISMSLLSLVVVLYQRLAAGSERASSRRWLRGLIAVSAILLLIVAAVFLFFTYGTGPAVQAILALYSSIKYVLSAIWSGVYALLNWLASFLSDPEPQELPEALPSFTPEELPESAIPDQRVWVAAAAIGVCILIAAAILILWNLRRFRIHGYTQTAKKSPSVRRRIPLLRWLQRLWDRLAGRLRLRMTLLAMRGTPQELFYFLTRTGRRLGLWKGAGETPAAFIRRLKALPATQADPPLLEALTALEQALYQTLYAPQGTAALAPRHGRCIRRRLNRALWRARWAALKQLPARARKESTAQGVPLKHTKKDS